jgi:hypothetical protein
LPASMLEIVEIDLDTGAIDSRSLKKLPLRSFRKAWAHLNYEAAHKPIQWTQINETRFQVAPRPDSNYPMYVTGTKIPARITDFSLEVTAVPKRYHESVLVYGLATMGASKIADMDRFKQNGGMYERGIESMVTEAKRDPDVEYEMKPYSPTGGAFTTEYWRQPHVRTLSDST